MIGIDVSRKRPVRETRRFVVMTTGAFFTTLCALAVTTPGLRGATAYAEDQPTNTAASEAVVSSFQPAVPRPGSVAPSSTTISGVDVSAQLIADETGRQVIAVTFDNHRRRTSTVACKVGLARLVRAEVPPMARYVPPPRREELFSELLRVAVAPREQIHQVVGLPDDLDISSSTGAAASNGGSNLGAATLAVSIEPFNGR